MDSKILFFFSQKWFILAVIIQVKQKCVYKTYILQKIGGVR